MKKHNAKQVVSFCLSVVTLTLPIISFSAAADGVEQAVKAFLAEGKPTVQLRYRFEHVDDDLVPADDAAASTLRAAIGYETGTYS